MSENTDDRLVEHENILLGHFIDEAENSDGGFFEHIGLPADASWGEFRRHYDKDGVPDIDRAANDLFTYPPIAERVEELKAEKARSEKETDG